MVAIWLTRDHCKTKAKYHSHCQQQQTSHHHSQKNSQHCSHFSFLKQFSYLKGQFTILIQLMIYHSKKRKKITHHSTIFITHNFISHNTHHTQLCTSSPHHTTPQHSSLHTAPFNPLWPLPQQF